MSDWALNRRRLLNIVDVNVSDCVNKPIKERCPSEANGYQRCFILMAAPVALYSIRDLSRDFDVTTRTLRFYEEKGLLEPERLGQKRLYTAADRVRLKLILRGKRLGFSLDESAELIAMYDPESNNAPQLQALIDKIQACLL